MAARIDGSKREMRDGDGNTNGAYGDGGDYSECKVSRCSGKLGSHAHFWHAAPRVPSALAAL